MKKPLLLSIFIMSSLYSSSQEIKFFNVGPQDKPLINIIVSKDSINKDSIYNDIFTQNIIVDSNIYDTIENYVLRNNTQSQPDEDTFSNIDDIYWCEYDFGCYAIEIKNKDLHLLYYMDSSDKSVDYFKRLIKLLDDNKWVFISSHFKYLLDRINILP